MPVWMLILQNPLMWIHWLLRSKPLWRHVEPNS